MRNSSIRTRLFAVCIGLSLVCGIVGGTGLFAHRSAVDAFGRVARDAMPSIAQLAELRSAMQTAMIAERSLMFMSMTNPQSKKLLSVQEAALGTALAGWKRLEGRIAGSADAQKFKKAFTYWHETALEVREILLENSPDARRDAIEISMEDGTMAFEAAQTVLGRLTDAESESARAYADQEEQHAADLAVLMIMIASIGCLVAFSVAGVLSRAIATPLGETVHAIRGIAEGDGDLTRRLTVHSETEIGQLGSWVNVFMDRLSDLILDVRNVTLELEDEAGQIRSSGSLASQSATDLTQGLSAIATAVEGVERDATGTAGSAAEARDLSRKTMGIADHGNAAMGDMTQAMGEVRESSGKISATLRLIDSIAAQTGLLSLNAAVEAARAGDAGRGFAVVATEVKELAVRSAEAAKSTKLIVDELQGRAQHGVELAERAVQCFGEIVESNRSIDDLLEGIASSSANQHSSLAEIRERMHRMDLSAQQSAAGSEQLAAIAVEGERQVRHLKSLVGMFKVAEGGAAPAVR